MNYEERPIRLPYLEAFQDAIAAIERLRATRNKLLKELNDMRCEAQEAKVAIQYNQELKAELAKTRKALAALHATGDEMADLLDNTDTNVCLIAWGMNETKHKAAIDAAKPLNTT